MQSLFILISANWRRQTLYGFDIRRSCGLSCSKPSSEPARSPRSPRPLVFLRSKIISRSSCFASPELRGWVHECLGHWALDIGLRDIPIKYGGFVVSLKHHFSLFEVSPMWYQVFLGFSSDHMSGSKHQYPSCSPKKQAKEVHRIRNSPRLTHPSQTCLFWRFPEIRQSPNHPF